MGQFCAQAIGIPIHECPQSKAVRMNSSDTYLFNFADNF